MTEICPNCGGFFDSLEDSSGFCGKCTQEVVGVLIEKTPTTKYRYQRSELWLLKNADIIENTMVTTGNKAKVVIKELALQNKAKCLCCGMEIPHGTNGRLLFCNKNEQCRKARRYYKYLRFEKGLDKEVSLRRALSKFTGVDNG